ncbi:thiamine-binding protein [Phycicoccus sp. BSK3Z-2]|uniref:Thiamine-binding protein n=1 Tax=Phycicoccus avicenniae TaxID=2828860 RepID=A0A941DAE0_9MICO|nr:thiamine-binding protein [Phycicoccus avicenniae]MBR7744063.1 thiamine-binding protein [Phycicoccus avicenniae]
MIAAFSIAGAPDDSGSYAVGVAEAVRIVRDSGLPYETNSMFTNIEGEWDEVMAVIGRCVDAMTAVNPRVSLVVKCDIRPGHTGQIEHKAARVQALLDED